MLFIHTSYYKFCFLVHLSNLTMDPLNYIFIPKEVSKIVTDQNALGAEDLLPVRARKYAACFWLRATTVLSLEEERATFV